MSSIKYQIQKTILANTVPEMSSKHKEANKIPTSRDEAKKVGKADKYIFSYADMKKIMYSTNRLAKHCGAKDLSELTKQKANNYLKSLEQSGKSVGYIKNEKYALSKFDKSMLNTGKRSKYDESIAPDYEIKSDGSDGSRSWGGRYTEQEVDSIIKNVSERSESAVEVIECQKESGLRISEALSITKENVDLKENKIKFYETGNKTKGGKAREVTISKEYAEKLKEKIKDKEKWEKIFNSCKKRNVQDQVNKACKEFKIKERGTHALRGYAAYQKLKKELKERGLNPTDARIKRIAEKHGNGLTEKEKDALKAVAKYLGHNRISVVRKHYLKR